MCVVILPSFLGKIAVGRNKKIVSVPKLETYKYVIIYTLSRCDFD